MSTSSHTYKDYSFADHGEVYQVLEKAFGHFKMDYYLIGANARDVHLYKAGTKPSRLTGDVDFAVMVPDFKTYQDLFKHLITQGFRESNEPYRLVYEATNTIIDLMPYGQVEQAHTVNFNKRDLIMSVIGYTEVGTQKEIFSIPEAGITIPVSPVEGLLILKLVAWNENPLRQKDLDDIAALLKISWDLHEEDAFANHLDLFGDDFEKTKVAARIIGRNMKPILEQNETLKNSITTILKTAIVDKNKAGTLEITLATTLKKNIEESKAILDEILKGIND